MKKIFYSVFISSLLIAGVAHAEDTMPSKGNMMIGGMPTMTGSGTPGMKGGDDHRMMPMMGSGTPPMMGSSSVPMCRKFSRGLSFGAKGDDVKDLQEMLHEKGFLDASSTGFFGKMTKDAVIKFQKDGGLNPSGFFGELSRKQHEKRCGDGMGRGDGKGMGMGSSTRPMMDNSRDDHMPPQMGSGTPPQIGGDDHKPMMGSSTKPCMTMFDSMTGKPCKSESDDHKPLMMGTGTPPTGIMCTMEARMCSDGSMMPRDNRCGWHPEGCKSGTSTIRIMPISVPAAPPAPTM